MSTARSGAAGRWRTSSPAKAVVAGVAVAASLAFAAPVALAAEPAHSRRSLSPAHPQRGVARAPAGGSLLSTTAGPPPPDEAAGSATVESDPLVGNGLGSPSCLPGAAAGELAATERSDCETSGFVAASAPTDDYGLDVHIDTGLLPFGRGEALSLIQDIVVTPVWLGLVWLVHALVSMLDWSFAIDLLEGGPLGGVATGLSAEGQAITFPLLAIALTGAALLLAHHGLVRRRAAQSLADTALAAAMVVGGLWLIADPSGSVGALARWTREAALGTLAAASQGSPSTPGQALGAGLHGLFAAAVEGPWCYLEFGNVAWCRDPRELDPALRRAADAIAAREQREARCSAVCEGRARSLAASARLLREGRTNGALFLALPANGPDRNSINDTGSLLRTLCRSAEATSCRGRGAEQAQFRTDGGTWPRLAGLLLIAIGAVGMLLMFGAVALRLLLAAVMALFLLLLAPAVVLVPALGERGRALFRAWIARLFGAIVTKLVYAFLLGVSLLVTGVLEALPGIGWWAQWLLASAFWWGTFLRRHELLAVPSALATDLRRSTTHRSLKSEAVRVGNDRLTKRLDDRREQKRIAQAEIARAAVAVTQVAASPVLTAGTTAPPGRERHPDRRRGEPDRALLELAASEAVAAGGRITERTPRVERIEQERAVARSRGDTRRAASLEARGSALADAQARDERIAAAARDAEPSAARMAFLDRQQRLRGASEPPGAGPRRDYPALAPLAGQTRQGYERLPSGEQRAARLLIDRELSARRRGVIEETGGGPGLGASDDPHSRRRRRPPNTPSRPRHAEPPSPIMEDARAVAEGRKRQLGFGRP